MSSFFYPIPVGLIEPGDGDPATRLMGRITAGTQYARTQGAIEISVYLNARDIVLYGQATADLPTGAREGTLCDGAKVCRQDEAGIGCFRAVTRDGEPVAYPLMTDAEYLSAINLLPGMYVVREGALEPQELLKDPLTAGVLRVGKIRYDTKGRALKRNVPAILYAWDKAAMEEKAGRGEMTDMEKAFFAAVIQQQRQTAWLESLTAARQ
jgi:hypothetical protein